MLGTHPQHLRQVHDELAEGDLDTPPGIVRLSYLAGGLRDTMRLWPTTTMFGHVGLTDVRFPYGKTLPSGCPVLIVNSFNHRNRQRVPYADRFAPEEWVSGDAGQNWQSISSATARKHAPAPAWHCPSARQCSPTCWWTARPRSPAQTLPRRGRYPTA